MLWQPKLLGELSIGRLSQVRVIIEHNHRDSFLAVVASQNFCLTELLVLIFFKINLLKIDVVIDEELFGSHTVSAPIGAKHRDRHNGQFRDHMAIGLGVTFKTACLSPGIGSASSVGRCNLPNPR